MVTDEALFQRILEKTKGSSKELALEQEKTCILSGVKWVEINIYL